MAGKPVEVELEAIYKLQIRRVQKKLEDLNRLENESDDGDEIGADLEIYRRQQELRAYITNYRVALAQLKRYGKYYTGNPIEESWLIGLTTVEKAVFIARFKSNQSFGEISESLKIVDPHKVYEAAYKKVMAAIQMGGEQCERNAGERL